MVHKKQTASYYNFQMFNKEINELYEYLKSNNCTEKEIRKIFVPLTSKKKTNYFDVVVFVLFTLVALLYGLTYFENISWHLTAIGRIFLIKLLPYWDWTHLKNKRCLVPNFSLAKKQQLFNCDLCENINKIDVYDMVDEGTLMQKYIEIDVPIIVTKGLNSWPRNTSFIQQLLQYDTIYRSYPCNLATNTHKGISKIGRILEQVGDFQEFFLHFRNCDTEAMKTFRKFTYRPDFLPAVYSPILYNWLIWNRNYNTTNFKAIELVEQITVVGQIKGSTHFRLLPRKNCEFECSTLNMQLDAGEALILTNLWNLEYRPHEGGENVAVVLETRD